MYYLLQLQVQVLPSWYTFYIHVHVFDYLLYIFVSGDKNLVQPSSHRCMN